MKNTVLIALICSPIGLFAQVVDSNALKTVDSLIEVSRGLTGKGDFVKALEANAAAEALALEKWGKMSESYGSVCVSYGRVFFYKGNYPTSEGWYLAAKGIREMLLGKQHKDYAATLNDMANLYKVMGKFEKSETLHLEALAIREMVLGKQHLDYAMSLNNLASLYKVTGEYEKAEPLHFQAKLIFEKLFGKNHAYYAMSLNNLGTLYTDMGEYEKAEKLLLEARTIRGNTLGKQHPNYALSLSNLAILYMDMGMHEKAEPLLVETIAIREKVLGKEHAEYAYSLGSLANLYVRFKNYDKAELLYLEAKKIQETAIGKDHPDYAWTLANLANFYKIVGDIEKSKPLCLEAEIIIKKAMGTTNHAYAWILDNLAFLYWSIGDMEAAKSLILESVGIEKKLISKASSHLSEQELASYAHKFNTRLGRDFSFTQLQSDMSANCYNNTLFHKGFLLNSVSHIGKLALADPATAEKYNLLKSYNRRLAAEYAKPIAERKNTAELEEKANTLEKDLARSVAGFGEALRQVTWQEVQQNLRPGEAAIEFVHYKFVNPKPTDSTMYAALVLRPDGKPPKFFLLFEEKQLEKLLLSTGKAKTDFVNALYSNGMLFDLLWQPLAQELAAVQTLYFSPSGLLHRLNIGAIPLPPMLRGEPTGGTLADCYHLIELGSTRQLVIPSATKTNGTDALLYGGIQYEMDSTAIASAIGSLDENTLASGRGLDFVDADSTFRGSKWNYLRWTDVEVSTTEEILADAGLSPTVRKRYEGTEESFKAIGANGSSPRVLHLATHGFFFPDPGGRDEGRGTRDDEPVFKVSGHPMIRAGLVLAGANHAWQTGKSYRPDREDGILTAYEISQVNLSNTELVVLSACETGLGDIQGNEGVYGLQRAFKIAGAKYLIMSLWQVPDFQTQELMTNFYSLWLEDKMTIPEAFRVAQKTMRDKYKSPFLWAGFVLVE